MVGGHSDSASSSEAECNPRSNHSSGGVGGGYSSGAQHGLSCTTEASLTILPSCILPCPMKDIMKKCYPFMPRKITDVTEYSGSFSEPRRPPLSMSSTQCLPFPALFKT